MATLSHFVLRWPDNGSYWLPDIKSAAYCCQVCGCKLSRNVGNPKFYLKKKSYDVSCTYDGFDICTEEFGRTLSACSHGSISLEALPFDKRYPTKFFRFEVSEVVKVDVGRSEPEFGKVCSACHQHKYVVGAKAYLLQEPAPLRSGVFRTDIEFAEGIEKHPVIVVSCNVAGVLKARKFKGLELRAVEATD
jgi:hypothetical protein